MGPRWPPRGPKIDPRWAKLGPRWRPKKLSWASCVDESEVQKTTPLPQEMANSLAEMARSEARVKSKRQREDIPSHLESKMQMLRKF